MINVTPRAHTGSRRFFSSPATRSYRGHSILKKAVMMREEEWVTTGRQT